jgi:hypothetical protein
MLFKHIDDLSFAIHLIPNNRTTFNLHFCVLLFLHHVTEYSTGPWTGQAKKKPYPHHSGDRAKIFLDSMKLFIYNASRAEGAAAGKPLSLEAPTTAPITYGNETSPCRYVILSSKGEERAVRMNPLILACYRIDDEHRTASPRNSLRLLDTLIATIRRTNLLILRTVLLKDNPRHFHAPELELQEKEWGAFNIGMRPEPD